MKNIEIQFDQLLNYTLPGTKISLYLPAQGEVPLERLFEGICATALKLLEKAEWEQGLKNEFADWMEKSKPLLREMKTCRTVAIFYAKDFQQVIALNEPTPTRIIVSQSFHLKPLRYVIDNQKEGYALEFNDYGIRLLRITNNHHNVIEAFLPPVTGTLPNPRWPEKLGREAYLSFLEEVSKQVPKGFPVTISCSPNGIARSLPFWKKHFPDCHVDELPFGYKNLESVTKNISERLRSTQAMALSEDIHRTLSTKNSLRDPQQILTAISENRVAHLYVSLEAMLWGTVDILKKNIIRNRIQKDHKDDDILDDIAEIALRKGIKVKVISQKDLPGNCEIVAC